MKPDYIKDKHVILGVCGGIAAYKSVEILRHLKKCGGNVRVVMTHNALTFVGPLTFEALSEQPVCTTLFEKHGNAAIRHIDWAREADAVIIAPATANIIGKIANGIADDALSTMVLAVTSPVLICPSMNTHMYLNRAVQQNIQKLKALGYAIVEPTAGALACGTTGPGRLPEPGDVVDRVVAYLTPKDLKGKTILVTAGPTQEPIDPVRFVSNPSSGKMGYAIAKAAEHRGGDVTLVSGPTDLPDVANVNTIRVRTAQEMADAVFAQAPESHIVIKSAAVSDYRPVDPKAQKIKKGEDETVLRLEKTDDILKKLGKRKKDGQILVGFAAETEDLEKNATQKLVNKNLDIIVGNLVGPSAGFGADANRVTFYFKNGKKEQLGEISKFEIAHVLLDRILELAD